MSASVTASSRMAPPMLASQVMPGTRSQGADGNLWESVKLASGAMRWKRVGETTTKARSGPRRAVKFAPASPAPTKPKPTPRQRAFAKPAPQPRRVPQPQAQPVADEYDDDEWDSEGWEDEVPQIAAPYRRPSPPQPVRQPSLQELRETARQAGIRNYTKMSKPQLLEALT